MADKKWQTKAAQKKADGKTALHFVEEHKGEVAKAAAKVKKKNPLHDNPRSGEKD